MREASADAVESSAGRALRDLRVSRRHVVQGIAWATPAVVIAAASPAAAASVDVGDAGAIVFSGLQVSRTAAGSGRALDVEFAVAHAISGGAEVRSLTSRVSFSPGMVGPALQAYEGEGWSPLGSGRLADGSQYFDFAFASPLLSGGITTPLRVTPSVPGTGFFDGTVTVHSEGSTVFGRASISVDADSTVGLDGARVHIDNVTILRVAAYPGGVMTPDKVTLSISGPRFAGSYWDPVSPPASHLHLVATIPDTLTALGADPVAAVKVAGTSTTWSVVSAVKEGRNWVITFAAPPEHEASQAATAANLEFAVPAPAGIANDNWHGTIVVAGYGMSGGARVNFTVGSADTGVYQVGA